MSEIITTEESIQYEAENSVIEADTTRPEDYIQFFAKNSIIKGNKFEIGYSAQYEAENSVIEANTIKVRKDVQGNARNSIIKGKKIEIGRLAQDGADSCLIEGEDVSIRVYAQAEAKNCYILASKKLRVRDIEGTYGGVIVAKELDVENLVDPLPTIITTSDIPKTTKCKEEDFEKILNYFKNNRLEVLGLFRIEKSDINYKTFLKEIKNLETLYEKIKDNFKLYDHFRDWLLDQIELYELPNKEKYEYLRNVKNEIKHKLKQKLNLKDESAEYIVNTKHKKLKHLVKLLDELENPDKFVSTFKDEETTIKHHLDFLEEKGLSDAYLLFEKTYLISSENFVESEENDANEILYKQGMKIISKIKHGEYQLNPRTPEIEELNSELRKVKEKLKKTKGKEGRDELKEIKTRIEELKKNKAERIRNSLREDYSLDELKEVLNQLSQHYLSGKPKEIARYISDSIKIIDEKDISNVLKISVWDKTIGSIPTYEEYRCCAFPGYEWGDLTSIAEYMEEPRVQLLKVGLDDKDGMVITFADDKTLIVDSVESRYHIFARKSVSEPLTKAIKDYAKSSGFERVIVSTSGMNSAHREFLEYVNGKIVKYKANLPKDCYLEFEGYGIEI